MALYISIVLLAAIVSLPDHFAAESDQGLNTLLFTIWGTTIGLALAHWFAFNVAAVGFRGGHLTRMDLQTVGAQLSGAATVALVTTIPLLLAHGDYFWDAAFIGPALVLTVAGYFVARWSGRTRMTSLIIGVLVLAAGLGIALIKGFLGGH